MVYYNNTASADFKQILLELVTCTTHQLTYEQALTCVDDIHAVCESFAYKNMHRQSSYEIYRKYGEYVHAYKRNKATTWYIIYNIAVSNDIWIEKIISNHLTDADKRK